MWKTPSFPRGHHPEIQSYAPKNPDLTGPDLSPDHPEKPGQNANPSI